MGALQSDLPNPAMLPQHWPLLIVDLKDSDELVSTAITVPLPQHVLAREAHSIFHQNAKELQKEFHISHAEATATVRSCPICCHHN
ncbi:POK10 protein, partial [Hirundo rustica]|nr:POK10 protein [Hirundo rustica]